MCTDERISCGYMLKILDSHSTRLGRRDGGRGRRSARYGRRCRRRWGVPLPLPPSRFPSRQALRHSLVEPLFALQEGIEVSKKHPRLRALDDPVVVRAGDSDDLRAGDFADRPGRDDRALALHESRHGRDRTQRAGIGELDRAAAEVVRHKTVSTSLFHQRLVGGVERGEIHPFGMLDHRYDQRPAAVLASFDHCEAESNRARIDAVRLAVDVLERVRHHREALGGLDDRVPDEVGEGDLLARRGQLGVERLAAGVENGGRDVAERGRRGDRQRLRHVGH